MMKGGRCLHHHLLQSHLLLAAALARGRAVEGVEIVQEDYVAAAVEKALRVHLAQPLPGDILIFMTGR